MSVGELRVLDVQLATHSADLAGLGLSPTSAASDVLADLRSLNSFELDAVTADMDCPIEHYRDDLVAPQRFEDRYLVRGPGRMPLQSHRHYTD